MAADGLPRAIDVTLRACGTCRTLLMDRESDFRCCNRGRDAEPPLPPLPAEMVRIASQTGFGRASHAVNQMFSLATVRYNGERLKFQQGLSCYKVRGTVSQVLGGAASHG